MDTFPAGLVSVTGPNGENSATLQSAGWSFTRVDASTLSIGRPSGLQAQPLVNVTTHGINGSVVWTKSPTAIANTGYAAEQTYSVSGGLFTALKIYGLNSTNTGLVSSGATNLIITFGLIS
jgi:hypothetical protein